MNLFAQMRAEQRVKNRVERKKLTPLEQLVVEHEKLKGRVQQLDARITEIEKLAAGSPDGLHDILQPFESPAAARAYQDQIDEDI